MVGLARCGPAMRRGRNTCVAPSGPSPTWAEAAGCPAVALTVDGKDVRSCSPERGYGFLGAQLEKKNIQLGRPPDPAQYAFDVRALRGKTARVELRDQHSDGCFFEVKITASDQKPGALVGSPGFCVYSRAHSFA